MPRKFHQPFAFLALQAILPITVCQAGEVIVHGVQRTCGSIIEMDRAMSATDDRYFRGWSDDDFDAAVAWSRACLRSGFMGNSREEMIGAFRTRADNQALYEKNQQETAQEEAARKVKDAEDAAAAARQYRLQEQSKYQQESAAAQKAERDAECQNARPFQLYQAQEDVIDDREGIAAARAAIAREKKVGEASGFVNMSTLHTAGEQIVQWQDDIREHFAAYKHLGGNAASAQTVTHRLADPCPE